jgi:cytochrome c-type biogenesis protein CcmH
MTYLLRVLLFLTSFLSFNQAYCNDFYPFSDVRQQAQFEHLLRELRCLVCQNQDLADSNASLATDLRNEVYHLVQAGQSDDEIVNFLTIRYGDFILFKPPMKAVTALLWFGPLFFLILGCWIFWCSCFRQPSSLSALGSQSHDE